MKYLLSLLFASTIVFAGDYVVIVNKNMKELRNSEIKAIFLKKVTYIDNIQMIPVNLEANDPVRIEFQEHFLGMDFKKLKTYWMKQHYLGHRPPISMKSQESIKEFVRKVDGAIGYIEAKNCDESVKIVYHWSEGWE